MGIINGGATLGDPHISLAAEWLNPAEQVNAAVALVLRIDPLDSTWFGRNRQQYIADELARLFVEAKNGTFGIEGTLIDVKDIL